MALQENPTYSPGDVVNTSFGAGVVTQCPRDPSETAYHVLLWRIPGKSIASASSSVLQESAVRLFDLLRSILHDRQV